MLGQATLTRLSMQQSAVAAIGSHARMCQMTPSQLRALVQRPRTYCSLTFRAVEEACEPGRFIGTETDLLQHADAGALSISGADDLLHMEMFGREWVKLLRIECLPANFQLALPHALSPLGMSIAEALHLELEDWFEGD